MASMTVARTQPDVVQPVTNSVSTRFHSSQAASSVAKKAEGCRLRMSSSPGAGVSSGTIWLSGLSSVSFNSPGALRVKAPASDPSAA